MTAQNNARPRAEAQLRCVTCLLAVGFALAATSAVSGGCRQALALGLDVSLSVDPNELRLQRDGLATALSAPQVVKALVGVPGARTELAVYEWSGQYDQSILVDWTTIDSHKDVEAISAALRTQPQLARTGRTAVGAAMLFGLDLLGQRSHCLQHTLDLSGDGISNNGMHPSSARSRLEDANIGVNALLITPENEPNALSTALIDHYETHVILGPQAFTEVIHGFDDYGPAMRRKLLRELSPALTWKLE